MKPIRAALRFTRLPLVVVLFVVSVAPAHAQSTAAPDAPVGRLVGWGSDGNGQLTIPADLGDVIAIAAGPWHSLAVKADGTVAAWGYDSYGQTVVPPGLTGVVAVAAGPHHSVALKTDGTVVTWGIVSGTPDGLTDVVAIAAGNGATLALKRDGTVIGWPAPSWYLPPDGLRDVVAIVAAMNNTAAALKSDGTVVGWGAGFVPSLTGIASLALGPDHGLAVREDGTVVGWGNNTWGALNIPPDLSDVVQVAAGAAHSLALRSDGTVVAWGENGSGQLAVPGGLTAAFIAAGVGHNLAFTTDDLPLIVADPRGRVVAAGDDVTLGLLAVGDAPLRYQWRIDGGDIPGATAPSLTLLDVQEEDEGAYRALFQDANGSVVSRSAFVRVQPAPPRIVTPPSSRTALAGTDVELRVRARGSAPLAYQWQKDEVDIAGATGLALRLPSVRPAAAGRYRVVVRNALGAVTSATAQLDVVRPDLVIDAVAGPSTAFRGESMAITDTVRNAGPTGATAGAFRVHFYLSPNRTITPEDRVIGSRDVRELAGGATSSATTTVTVPLDMPSGVYYVGAIVDGRGDIAESAEGNNERAAIAATTVLALRELSVARHGSGAVTSSPGGITCGTDCAERYPETTEVTLTARAATGFAFAGWRGACVWTGPCVVSMHRAQTVSATFVEVAPGTLTRGIQSYTGPLPEARSMTYRDETGVLRTVTAIPGQAHVIFDPLTSADNARAAIEARGGRVLEQVPAIGHYLVGVTAGGERTFIDAMRGRPHVLSAAPHVVGLRGAVTLFEGCTPGDTHYAEVRRVLQREGGTFDECRHIAANARWISVPRIVKQLALEANENTTGTTLINLSSYGAHLNGVDWTRLAPDVRGRLQDEWFAFMRITLLAVANLPAEYRDRLVMTICAGNNNMPIEALMRRLRAEPRLAGILRDNVLVVTTTLMRGNRGGADPDVAIMNNVDARNGTSFAAPAAMAVLETIMRQTGASARQALRAMKIAVATNALRRLVPSEAIDKARAIVAAGGGDPPGAVDVTAIAFTSVGGTTAAVITPALAGVSVQYTVSGTDGYYASGVQRTDAGGRVSFSIPPGESGVVDRISVVALLSGRIATATFTWDVRTGGTLASWRSVRPPPAGSPAPPRR